VDTLVLVGGLTNGGIEHAARHGADAGYRVIIPEDAIAGLNPVWHRNAIEGFLPAVATIVSTQDVIDALKDR